jgi:hypothetical protein
MQHAHLLAARRETTARGEEDPDHINYDVENIKEYAASESARQELNRLITKLNRRFETDKIKIVIHVDGAHTLTESKPKIGDDGKSLYDHLSSCLNRFFAYPIFAIFLSINSSLVEFAAPRALAKSSCIRGDNAVTHPPITETPFDCVEDFIVNPGTLTMRDTSEIPFMAQFGRPSVSLFNDSLLP